MDQNTSVSGPVNAGQWQYTLCKTYVELNKLMAYVLIVRRS